MDFWMCAPKSGIAYIRALRAKARHLVRNLALFILKQNFTLKKGVLLKFEREKLVLARICRFCLPFPPESHKTFSLFSEAGWGEGGGRNDYYYLQWCESMAAKLLPGDTLQTDSRRASVWLFFCCCQFCLFAESLSAIRGEKLGNSIVDTWGVSGGKWRTHQFSSHRCVFQFLLESLEALCVRIAGNMVQQ